MVGPTDDLRGTERDGSLFNFVVRNASFGREAFSNADANVLQLKRLPTLCLSDGRCLMRACGLRVRYWRGRTQAEETGANAQRLMGC